MTTPERKFTFIYSAQKSGFRNDAVYENPRYFEKLPKNVKDYKEVLMLGSYPKVEQALKEAGVDWRQMEPEDMHATPTGGPTDARSSTVATHIAPAPATPTGGPTAGQDGGVQQAPHIPDGWRSLKWPELRALASSLSEGAAPIIRRDMAERVIELELEKRS